MDFTFSKWCVCVSYLNFSIFIKKFLIFLRMLLFGVINVWFSLRILITCYDIKLRFDLFECNSDHSFWFMFDFIFLLLSSKKINAKHLFYHSFELILRGKICVVRCLFKWLIFFANGSCKLFQFWFNSPQFMLKKYLIL